MGMTSLHDLSSPILQKTDLVCFIFKYYHYFCIILQMEL